MKKKTILLILIIFIILGLGGSYFYIFNDYNPFFNAGGRYDSKVLNDLGVIFENDSDLGEINGGFSTTASCPWGRAHEGFDYPLKNNSKVIAAAPGQVAKIIDKYFPENGINNYMIEVQIRFNQTTIVEYNFEPWASEKSQIDLQRSMINVSIGTWVQKGDVIARFLALNSSAHVHFDVKENGVRRRLDLYWSDSAYEHLLNLTHLTHPRWPYLCYDENTPMNYMRVLYKNESDIAAFNEGFSKTTSCPWGFVHQGIDFFFKNHSEVFPATPGRVELINLNDFGESEENRYRIEVRIRYNDTIMALYNFEPWTTSLALAQQQLSLINVHEGDYVFFDLPFAEFIGNSSGAHVHFSLVENDQQYCPQKYYSEFDYNNLLDLIHSYHPTWNLCYT